MENIFVSDGMLLADKNLVNEFTILTRGPESCQGEKNRKGRDTEQDFLGLVEFSLGLQLTHHELVNLVVGNIPCVFYIEISELLFGLIEVPLSFEIVLGGDNREFPLCSATTWSLGFFGSGSHVFEFL